VTDTLFAPLLPDLRRQLDVIPALIDTVFPLPGRFRADLPASVAELSRLLTAGRGERSLSYLGRSPLLSAYLRFFVPWNLYRLCRLLPGLDLSLAANDRVTDLGCGPLTLALALWISRPDLRSLPLEFQCIDRSGPALDAGKKLFAALAGENSPWKIHTIKGDIATVKAKPSALVCAINVFNEMYGDISRTRSDNLQYSAEKSVRLLNGFAGSKAGGFLVVEPGFPRCGEFISLLRSAFIECGRSPVSPCPHDQVCPCTAGMPAKRWCHFAFETDNAPQTLHRLSQAARLPKERATLSFLFVGEMKSREVDSGNSSVLRVISDAFPVPPNHFGRYCCSSQGLVLLTGEKNTIEKTHSGAMVTAAIKKDRDPKSSTFLAELK